MMYGEREERRGEEREWRKNLTTNQPASWWAAIQAGRLGSRPAGHCNTSMGLSSSFRVKVGKKETGHEWNTGQVFTAYLLPTLITKMEQYGEVYCVSVSQPLFYISSSVVTYLIDVFEDMLTSLLPMQTIYSPAESSKKASIYLYGAIKS